MGIKTKRTATNPESEGWTMVSIVQVEARLLFVLEIPHSATMQQGKPTDSQPDRELVIVIAVVKC